MGTGGHAQVGIVVGICSGHIVGTVGSIGGHTGYIGGHICGPLYPLYSGYSGGPAQT